MPERPIYYTQPDEQDKTPITLGQTGCVILFAGGVFGGISGVASNFIWGSEVGLRVGVEVGVGMSGLMGGGIMGIASAERAENFAKAGRKRRAYVEALRASLESAIGLAIAGGTAGYVTGDIPGAVIGVAVGVLIGGGGLSQVAFANVSRGLKEANTPEVQEPTS